MEWSKSFESWNAGGSEYYVLITDTAGSRVTLIPSHDTPIEDFAHYTGKHVRVMGNYVEGTPDIPPENSEEQTISPVVNPITGKTDYPIRGSGFRVDKIKIIN